MDKVILYSIIKYLVLRLNGWGLISIGLDRFELFVTCLPIDDLERAIFSAKTLVTIKTKSSSEPHFQWINVSIFSLYLKPIGKTMDILEYSQIKLS